MEEPGQKAAFMLQQLNKILSLFIAVKAGSLLFRFPAFTQYLKSGVMIFETQKRQNVFYDVNMMTVNAEDNNCRMLPDDKRKDSEHFYNL